MSATVRSVVPLAIHPLTNVRSTLSVYRYGHGDPTTRVTTNDFHRATLTPDGPGTLRIWWSRDHLDACAWGPGAEWLLARVPGITGAIDAGHTFDTAAHPVILRAQRNHPATRIGSSGMLYHELLPVILGQRVTSVEAFSQWRRLVHRLGEPAPGPELGLRVPPTPQQVLAHPAWWFHPMGVEAKRAEAMRTVARHARRIEEWTALSPDLAATKLRLLPGIGAWTIGSALGPALGDPDAVPVGDYHVPNTVSFALAGEARGTDARMLELLQPYVGQRGRVIHLLGLDGHSAPKFGPRQRIQPVYRR